ncbi:MAG: protocatechuate 3,4-dioxygenase subunit alpha [Gemmatimonadota bacterium]
MSDLTPFQTVGPFFSMALPFEGGETLAGDATLGRRITIEGRLTDGAATPMPDALIEVWQANAAGKYRHSDDRQDRAVDPAFEGFGRAPTDEDGRFAFHTIMPGVVPGPEGRVQAPHVLIGILARGVLTRFVTRVYFPDEPANALDPILAQVPAERRPTLIAAATGENRYRFDIRIQGDRETVFFDV